MILWLVRISIKRPCNIYSRLSWSSLLSYVSLQASWHSMAVQHPPTSPLKWVSVVVFFIAQFHNAQCSPENFPPFLMQLKWGILIWPIQDDRKIIFWSYSPRYSPVQDLCFNEFISFLRHFYFFGHIHWFFSQVQRLMFVGVIFGHVLSFTLLGVNFIPSYSNPFSVILNRSK